MGDFYIAENEKWYPLGVTEVRGGYHFATTAGRESCALVLFKAGKEQPFQKISFRKEDRVGDVWNMTLMGTDFRGLEYAYEADGGLTADGCGPTKIVIADKDSGEQPRVEKGYLVERYYKDGYSQDADGNPIARAMTKTYAEGFYMGLRAGLHFKIDEAKHTVTATVTIYRDKDLTDKIYSDSLIIDLRYDISVKTEVTATKKPA